MGSSTVEERSNFGRLLRSDIVSGRFSPNERLIEADLAERYGVRRGVVRVVLAELVHEGLAVRTVNRGARVRVVSTAEAIEISEARLAMEAVCAAKAARRATDEQLAQMTDAIERMKEVAAKGDILGFSAVVHEIHHYVRSFSQHTVGMQIAEQLRDQSIRYQFGEMMVIGRLSASLAEHVEIVESIVARDAKRAEEAVRRHCEGFIEAILAMEERGQGVPPGGAATDRDPRTTA